MASKIYVGGLSYSTTSDALRQHFAQCGTVTSAEVVTDRDSSQSRGFGFVEMSSEAEAQAAIAKLNDQPLDGRPLRISVAKARNERSGGGGGGRGQRW
jgi:cold-inducible RNA-binding protein